MKDRAPWIVVRLPRVTSYLRQDTFLHQMMPDQLRAGRPMRQRGKVL